MQSADSSMLALGCGYVRRPEAQKQMDEAEYDAEACAACSRSVLINADREADKLATC